MSHELYYKLPTRSHNRTIILQLMENILHVQFCSFSWFALIELLLSLGGFIFTIALGVVITIGLDDTCRAFQTINNLEDEATFMPYVANTLWFLWMS